MGEFEVNFKVNDKLLTIKLQPSEVGLYNKLTNDDIYSKQYIELLIKKGLFILDGDQGHEIREICRIIENKEQLIFHSNLLRNLDHNDQLLTEQNKENDGTHSKFESEHVDKSCDFWTNSATSFMLDKYETYLGNIGPMKRFKTKKQMWLQISKDMTEMLNISKTPIQIENRYKTILKRKKKAVENNSKSGSSREEVPFEEQLKKIARSDDSIEPEVLRSARNVKYPKLDAAQMLSEKTCKIGPTTDVTEKSSEVIKARKITQDKRWEYYEKKEAAKEKRHQEKMNLIRELFGKKETE
ncbi:PREDICTED: uncharacterized protein LOC105556053 [Vollenhovia emeryi]|uniref:uncharacterized protein LOC105556053 n=1 Tax=Vollenhovia emeryi TaxID=411798 RepID=UPI0005F3972F|nr:PREDICTED: uncharacterized protein LOC105556053 [Vollenhovia emeryi]